MPVSLAALTAGAVRSVDATSWVNIFSDDTRISNVPRDHESLHFVRLSRKPSNLCALLRSHEDMVRLYVDELCRRQSSKTKLLFRSAYGPGPLIYADCLLGRVIDALFSPVALFTVQ
jgi:hypothetical protein